MRLGASFAQWRIIYAFLKAKLSPRNSNNKTSKPTTGYTDAREKSLHSSSKPHAHHSPCFPQQHAPLQLVLSVTAAAAELFYSPSRPTTPEYLPLENFRNTNQSRNLERVEGRKKHPWMRLFQESTRSKKSSSGVNTGKSVK